MRKSAPYLQSSESLTVPELERYARGWILDGDTRQLSVRTLEARRDLVGKLLWFLRQAEYRECGRPELRAFLAYVSQGHQAEGGRWGNPRMTKAVKPATAVTYFVNLKTLCGFLVDEGALSVSPMAGLKPPVNRPDQIEPFSQDQVLALIDAAKISHHPRRNEAIVRFLLDTGARASETCALRLADVDLANRRCRVEGKGGKSRLLPFGGNTTRALWAYLRETEERDPSQPLFTADAGRRPGEALTRSGLLQLLDRLGTKAGVVGVRCSPHTLRHTFAVEFLRAGGNVFTLKELLGHSGLQMTNRYVQLAQADIEAQHRRFSPGDRLKRRGGV